MLIEGLVGVMALIAAASLPVDLYYDINISLDSLRSDRFTEITARDALNRVLDGIDAALEAGLDPVKVNCVLVRGVNDDEVVDFARFARETGYEVRFIEFMPLDEQGAWTRDAVVPSREVLARIDAAYPIEPVQQ